MLPPPRTRSPTSLPSREDWRPTASPTAPPRPLRAVTAPRPAPAPRAALTMLPTPARASNSWTGASAMTSGSPAATSARPPAAGAAAAPARRHPQSHRLPHQTLRLPPHLPPHRDRLLTARTLQCRTASATAPARIRRTGASAGSSG
ncbi:hypothetical protein F751_1189 [Auxenochlorella protothecoides]|uniref:Uncharacterized protein n=1 Tax=Auxenochlorella protothecoides TaxID=3075 RepID=A0A087SNV8_AUXPR|nr:hypothetical protein F751_1189 [Auxenochlorella protothecoides]KFM27412.1 hypothetical protein F751_1189 [Auxenochlorella protothecoides]